jgi:uncharacterized protein with HEPN domain
MSEELKKYLLDVLVAIQSIEEYLAGQYSFSVYQNNKMLRRAVERELEIIGEAINRALKVQNDLPIAHARRIVDTRNRIIHAYDSVNDTVIWSILIRHLPLLKKEIDDLLHKTAP